MKAIERHRQSWQGKSDEWLFERLDNELKQKIEEIHRLLAENEALSNLNQNKMKQTQVEQKANELANKFYRGDIFTHEKEAHLLELEQARKYALIAVDEILKALDEHQWQNRNVIEFYFYVKQEIEKL